MKTFRSEKPEETEELAEYVAQWILQQNSEQGALVLALNGELGSGKTTFVQDLASSLEVEEKILSPTFVILKKFNLSVSGFETLYHIDCYRVESSEELLNLDFEEIIKDPTNLVVIEWANKIKDILPENYLELQFKIKGKRERKIILNNK